MSEATLTSLDLIPTSYNRITMTYQAVTPRPVGAFQVTHSDKNANSYRFMAHRPQRQPLQLLYPGRYLDNTYMPNGVNIPHEHPEALARTRSTYLSLARTANDELVADAHRLGGTGRLIAHPFVEPDVFVRDPALGYQAVSQGVSNPPLGGYPSAR